MRWVLAAIILTILVCLGLLLTWPSLTGPRTLEACSGVYRGLRVTLKVNDSTLKVDEALKVEVGVVNVGHEPKTLYHDHPLLFIAIYNVTTGEKLRIYPSFMLDVIITTALQPGKAISKIYELRFNKPGSYALTGLAMFSLERSPSKGVTLETAKVVIKVQEDSTP